MQPCKNKGLHVNWPFLHFSGGHLWMQCGILAMARSGGNTVTMYDTSFSALIKLDYILHFRSQRLRSLFFGQHQESRPMERSKTGSLQFMDFLSLCKCSGSNPINLVGWEYEMITLRMLEKLDSPRGHDSSCWQKGVQLLEKRML